MALWSVVFFFCKNVQHKNIASYLLWGLFSSWVLSRWSCPNGKFLRVLFCCFIKAKPDAQWFFVKPGFFDVCVVLKGTLSVLFTNLGMVFCYQNCSDLLWEIIVLGTKKNFWKSRLKAEDLQNFWDHSNERSE